MRNLSFILILLSSFSTQGQTLPDSIVKATNRYTSILPQEKVYLHLDRPHYAPGDTIWFKAYLVDARSHAADSISKNIYVDFFQKDNGKLIRQLLVKNTGGLSRSSIKLSDSLQEGVYEIRAYTRWMRNFRNDYFFHKEVFVRKSYGLTNQPTQEDINARLEVADLQFFSEGGNLVAGLQNRVAFKAVNKFGQGVDFKAFIISEHKDTVATIASQHLGMGSFVFKPKADEIYYLRTEKAGAKQFQLPLRTASGYSFFVDNLSNKEMIKISARNNFPVKDRPVLIGHQRGEIVFAFQSKTEGNSFTWTLPKSDIKRNGVVHLTLFNGQGTPQCERLIYNHAELPLQISIASDKTEYQPREKIVLSIKVTDENDNPVTGNFSLSATDIHQVAPVVNGENICNYLYLTSDVEALKESEIKGTIEQPEYYFDKTNLNAVVHLDILLMTQGWRRFVWSDVLNQPKPTAQFGIETGISVSGKALSTNRKVGKPIDVSLFYTFKDAPAEYFKTKTDAEGKFTFSDLDVQGQVNGFLQGNKESGGRNVTLTVEEADRPPYTPRPNLLDPLLLSKDDINSILERQAHYADLDAKLSQSKSKLLKEVVVSAKKEPVRDSRKTFYEGTNAYTVAINNSMCAGVLSVLQMLQGRVPGLQINSSSTGFIPVLNRGGSLFGSNSPKILVDGVLTDLQFLNAMSPCNVESIDVITHPVASLNALGLISILTKQGNPNHDWSKDQPPGTVLVKIHGYDIPKEFYSPKYLLQETSASTGIPDFRATLYWNPEIKTDEEGNAKVIFWNSDETTSIRVGLEGLSDQGKPGWATYQYTINK